MLLEMQLAASRKGFLEGLPGALTPHLHPYPTTRSTSTSTSTAHSISFSAPSVITRLLVADEALHQLIQL